ncbi:hypothetical protein [Nocardioides mangrovi]|uniref:Type 4a pilus biogenesis protein PilO n=1 Tax=Nocardioides mangrovi TaxID=2874580 RepID=A0ABS7UIE5_9ACTN|nr:hypothetical protein [Nocardioides mangrovi]MBZ5740030.1 hypothetical protein [Nocardioides mangrovi]MBZ5740799.1 hypothetical protein [Nocardioides mangrovi]
MNPRSFPGTVAIGTVAVVAVAALSWLFLLHPLLEETGDVHATTQSTQERNLEMTSQVTALRRERDELPAYDRLAATLAGAFPGTADQPGFFRAVTAAATDAGIPAQAITTLSPSAPVLLDATGQPITEDTRASTPSPPRAGLARQTVSVVVTCDDAQARRLLANLEHMRRAFLVSSLSVAAAPDGGPALIVSVTGSTYVAPPVSYAAADSPPDGADRASVTESQG